jgi:NADH-quinone oxidoreductase subunit L
MKITFVTFAIGMMALSGVPFFFSGFWSKEAILHAAHEWDVSHLPLYAGLAAVVLTAFYMTRLVAETFFGKPRSSNASHAHENSAVMTVPLIILAACAMALSLLGWPSSWLQHQLDPQFQIEAGGHGLMILSIVLVGAGLGTGWWIYGRKLRLTAEAADPLNVAAPAVMAALANRLGFDELYAATVGRLNTAVATVADLFDRFILDGAIRLLAGLGEMTGLVNRSVDEDSLNGGFDTVSESLRDTGLRYSRAQTGRPQSYLRTIALAFIVLVLIFLLGGGR